MIWGIIVEVRDGALIVDVGNLDDAASKAERNVVTVTRERRTSHHAIANIRIIELNIVITFPFLLANNAGIEHILA